MMQIPDFSRTPAVPIFGPFPPPKLCPRVLVCGEAPLVDELRTWAESAGRAPKSLCWSPDSRTAVHIVLICGAIRSGRDGLLERVPEWRSGGARITWFPPVEAVERDRQAPVHPFQQRLEQMIAPQCVAARMQFAIVGQKHRQCSERNVRSGLLSPVPGRGPAAVILMKGYGSAKRLFRAAIRRRFPGRRICAGGESGRDDRFRYGGNPVGKQLSLMRVGVLEWRS